MSTKYRTTPTSTTGMPGGIPYIIGNEAAERFSFYGMKAILAVFMAQYLHLLGNTAGVAMSEPEAVEKVHLFNSAVYLTPFLGALVSDLLWGKYKTIIRLSVIYCIGHGTLALMGGFGDAGHWLFAGLFLISVGSGGIKPCVSAHVGDQFGKQNAHLLPKIFNIFYFSINLGSFISTLLTPWLLEWYGPHWAFGIPGVLMALATLMFWMGRKKFIHIPAKGRGFVREITSSVGIKAIVKLSVIYAFVAIFWALFDQTGSSWVFQAQDMNLNLFGREWLSSQVQALNPIMVLALIPIFTFLIYPAVDKIFKLTPLRKISIGLFIMVIAFGIITYVQILIDNGGRPNIGWHMFAYLLLTASEVMVSIVCLEFSYTQAPKTMKSVIMAFFLFSISLGNFFTAAVNSYIQVPNPLKAIAEEVEKESPKVAAVTNKTHPGLDKKEGTPDDIQLTFQGKKLIKTEFPGYATFQEAKSKIVTTMAETKALPTNEEGNTLIAGLKDPWGQQITYALANSMTARLFTSGADKTPMTKWDTGLILEAPEPEKTEEEIAKDSEHRKTWLEKRIEELQADSTSTKLETPDTAYVGGQTKLEGASYFWFFTWVMLGTALAFVVVAKFYKPVTYLHDEEELDTEAEAEATAQ